MEIPRYASSVRLCNMNAHSLIRSADTAHADHTICLAVKEQTTEETTTFLLGSLSQVRRTWETQAGNDLGRVSS